MVLLHYFIFIIYCFFVYVLLTCDNLNVDGKTNNGILSASYSVPCRSKAIPSSGLSPSCLFLLIRFLILSRAHSLSVFDLVMVIVLYLEHNILSIC